MTRRDFLRLGASGAVAGAAATGALATEATEAAEAAAEAAATRAAAAGRQISAGSRPTRGPSFGKAAPVLSTYSAEDHRRRLLNIRRCETAIRSCLRKHLITGYLPGQACYNLGEYPSAVPWEPSEYDEGELDRLRDHGIELIQVFDDWNDSLRLFGGDKYTAVNPAGYARFIEMAHARGMKVLTYTSTCFLQRTDPDFRQEWSREGDFLVVGYWDMARCSPASPGWRAFLLPRIVRILDEYGSDGIYIDGGYLSNQHAAKRNMPPADDEVPAFQETPEHDGAFADLLALIHAEVKRRGGILKLHVNAAERPLSGGLGVYDYLWVGEGVAHADSLREAVKDYPPYVVPCLDMGFTTIESEDEPYLHSIPYMQFPVLSAGRIFTGERGMVAGIKYNEDFWLERCRDAWRQYRADPSGLHTYSVWDALPGDPETRPTHARWLERYRAMTREGTWAWLEIGESSLWKAPLPRGVVASAFANVDLYLVLANYSGEPAEVVTDGPYVSVSDPSDPPGASWKLPRRSLRILRRAG